MAVLEGDGKDSISDSANSCNSGSVLVFEIFWNFEMALMNLCSIPRDVEK